MDEILDEDIQKAMGECFKKTCPSAEDLKRYPLLDEDDFNGIDEKLFSCPQCRKRQEYLNS